MSTTEGRSASATPAFGRLQRQAVRRAAQEAATAPDTPRSRAPTSASPSVSAEVLDSVQYVELHAHSNYSLLEGASHLDELLREAVQQGHRALALTDHDAMFGAM